MTEANPLTFPENASLAEENFVLNRDGSRQRRFGLDYEENNTKSSKNYTEGSGADIDHFLWKNAGSIQNVNISVLKIGRFFWFFDNNADSVSASTLNGGNSISVAGFDSTGSGNPVTYDYTFINGKMFVASGYKTITILSYDEATDTVSKETKTVSVRDVFGIHEEGVVVDKRSSTISSAHAYNLLNQGWVDNISIVVNDVVEEDLDSISTAKFGSTPPSLYPSNADVLRGFKIVAASSERAIGLFGPKRMIDTTLGTRHAPKGHTIFSNMFARGSVRQNALKARSGAFVWDITGNSDIDNNIANASLFSTTAIEATDGGITNLVSFNGRMFYTVTENGIVSQDDESPAFGSMVFFSQATDGVEGLTRCYTELDPTDSDNYALLATDGGHVTLSGVGTINTLEVLGGSLFIFADNGVWQINGGSSIFTASNISVTRITNIGNINRKGVVVAENVIFYITDAGLYQIALNENDGNLPATVSNLSQNTIQEFFDSISFESKQKSKSSYDRYSNSIKWLFDSNGLPDESYFDTELVLDLNLGAFYVNKIKTVDDVSGEGTPYIVGYLERPSAILIEDSSNIIVGGSPVVVGANDVVITFRSIDSSVLSSNKYWVASKNSPTTLNFSVAEYKDLLFRDWGSVLNTTGSFGADAYAFLLTGYLTGGDSSVAKRITYITSHFRRTERILTAVADGFEADNPSSCILTAQWEWTSSENAGRWSNPQQIYRLPRTFIPDTGLFNYGHEVVTTKTKLRGKGNALSLLFASEPLKDCHIYGWSYEINMENSV